MAAGKAEIISFKVDPSLLDALKGVRNRSAFIREAILAALDNLCPLCGGTGLLTAKQREHWDDFSRGHAVAECDDCHEFHLVCVDRDTE